MEIFRPLKLPGSTFDQTVSVRPSHGARKRIYDLCEQRNAREATLAKVILDVGLTYSEMAGFPQAIQLRAAYLKKVLPPVEPLRTSENFEPHSVMMDPQFTVRVSTLWRERLYDLCRAQDMDEGRMLRIVVDVGLALAQRADFRTVRELEDVPGYICGLVKPARKK